jgi:hypothetical protein
MEEEKRRRMKSKTKKNGDCELLKEFVSTNISNIFHLAVCTISK